MVRDCLQNFRVIIIGDGHTTACCPVCTQLVPPQDQSKLTKDGHELGFVLYDIGGNSDEGGKWNELAVVGGGVVDSCGKNIDGSFNVRKTCIESLVRLEIP